MESSSNDPEVGGFDEEAKQQISFVLQQYEESSGSSSENSSLASSISDDGYEEDEESHVGFLNFSVANCYCEQFTVGYTAFRPCKIKRVPYHTTYVERT